MENKGLQEELARRVKRDGIPRYINADGEIRKCDWELSRVNLEDDLQGEELEAHIAKLIEEQSGQQG